MVDENSWPRKVGLLAQCYSLEQRRTGPINQMLCWHFPANAGSEKQL